MKTPPKNSITLISDTHGKLKRYHEIIRQSQKYPYTVQLGDFTMGHNSLKTLDNVDPLCHLIIPGNHDQYSDIPNYKHFLGDYGYTTHNGVSFFYYRGAYSIDKMYRTIGLTWFEQEEVSKDQFEKAKELYVKVKPDIFLAHTCPYKVADLLLEPWQQKFNSFTEYALQELVDIHQPKFYYFGHFHMSCINKIGNTKYQCLNELEVLTINEKGEPVICGYCGIQYDKGNCDCGNQWV